MQKLNSNYYKELKNEAERLSNKYSESPWKGILKIIWWNFTWLLKLCKNHFYSKRKCEKSKAEQDQNTDESVLALAFKLGGGFGDIIVAGNYIKELYKYTKGVCRFHICVLQDINSTKSLLNGHNHIVSIMSFSTMDSKLEQYYYDAIFEVRRYPKLEYCNKQRIKELSPDLLHFVQRIELFGESFQKYFYEDTRAHIFSVLREQNRRNQPDIERLLNMTDDVKPYVLINPAKFEIINELKLISNNYITFQRGTNITLPQICTKNWPLNHYRELISKIKIKYPGLTTVMLGRADNESADIDEVDINLCGKTDFDELKVILKHSRLHIDGECGLVYLKNALNGK